MKNTIKTSLSLLIALASVNSYAQKKEKKVQFFSISRTINAPASAVWKIVGEQYGSIANSHPGVVKSEYTLDSIQEGGEGCERVCYFNEKETKYTQEKQVNFNRDSMSFKVQISHAQGFPLDPEYSFATYQVIPIDENSCKLIFNNTYRTTPAFMGALVKGKFKKTIEDYLLSVEHHVLTGENVTKENFKTIKKKQITQN